MPTRASRDKIAEIGGDGIGPEVVAEAVRVLVAKALHDPKARTRDIGGEASTRAAGDAVTKAL